MNRWFGYAARVIVSIAWVSGGLSTLSNTAFAQYDQTRQTYDNIQLRRSVRDLQRQPAQIVPDSQRQQVQQLRRDVNRNRGLSSNRQQLNRQLDRVDRELSVPREQALPRAPLNPARTASLPSSVEPTSYLPSFGQPLSNAIGMIERAEMALAEGRVHQARSDLATASRELDSASAETAEEAVAMESAASRIAALEAQLTTN